MKQIRRNVFETNSSSTHSITITNRRKMKNDIPRNLDEPIVLYEIEDVQADGQDLNTVTNTYSTELSKARYLCHMIISYIYDNELQYEIVPKEFDSFCGDYEGRTKYLETHKDEIKKKVFGNNLFKWLKEVIKEVTGTDVIIDDSSDYYPYWQTLYDESKTIDVVLNLRDHIEDEEKFKERIKDIIFNEDIVINDIDEAYYTEPDEGTYNER